MRFFRDVPRFKARKRLYGDRDSLVAIIQGTATEIELDYGNPDDNSDGFTPSELAEMNGRTDDTPIYIAVKGHIYDVSGAPDLYGPTGPYKLLVGRDASSLFATGCCEEECAKIWYTSTISHRDLGLTESDDKEINSWVELYHLHDTYTYVGELVVDLIESTLSDQMEEDELDKQMDAEHSAKGGSSMFALKEQLGMEKSTEKSGFGQKGQEENNDSEDFENIEFNLDDDIYMIAAYGGTLVYLCSIA